MNRYSFADGRGRHFVALVLEPGNLERLKQHLPIEIEIEEMFPKGVPGGFTLAIAYSETPIADAKYLESLTPHSFVHARKDRMAEVRPHCPECKSTIEQLGLMRGTSPVDIFFCPVCGCVLGSQMKNGMTI
jgi:hypothetical protein